jgi:hypothetical protein
LLAASAGLGAHPAVLVVRGVLLTLVTAQAACFGTSLEGRPRHLRLEGRLPRHYPAGGGAHVGAVQVEPDAAGERLGIVLAEAGVGASCATLGAVVAGFYALHQRGGVHRGAARVSLEHLLGVGHDGTPSYRTLTMPIVIFHLGVSLIRVLC